jgi:folylpolyglutamate synthase
MEPVTSEVFHEVEKTVLKRNREADIRATEFELLTATAFEIFTRSELDVAVVEVGVGGRLDATNIIGQPFVDENGEPTKKLRPLPSVTVITKIGMDHQGLLGNTIEEIATEKAGICKPPARLVFDGSNTSRVKKILNVPGTRATSSATCDTSFVQSPSAQRWQPHVKQNAMTACLATQVALEGMGILDPRDHLEDDANFKVTRKHFLSNLEHLNLRDGHDTRPGRRINPTPIIVKDRNELYVDLQNEMAEAVSQTVFPGRQEWIDISSLTGREEKVLLDGAHNPQSAAVLSEKVAELRGIDHEADIVEASCPITWVVAMTKGKEVDDFFKHLLTPGDNVVTVEFGPVDGMPWIEPTSAGELLASVREIVPELGVTHDCGKDVLAAIRTASQLAENAFGQKLVIAGSLYLVGDVHRLLRQSTSHG